MTAIDPRSAIRSADAPPRSPRPVPGVGRLTRAGRGLHGTPERRRVRVTTLLLAGDAAAAVLSALLVGLPATVAAGLVTVALLAAAGKGLYENRLTVSAFDDLPALAASGLVAGGAAAALASLSAPAVHAGRAVVAAALWIVLSALARAGCYAAVRATRRRWDCASPTLILGAGVVGTRIADALADHREYGLRPIGYLDDDPLRRETPGLELPVLARCADLRRVVAETRARTIIVAFSSMSESRLVEVLRQCDRLDCEIFIVPRLFELNQPRRFDHIWGVPVMPLRRPAFRSTLWAAKRVFDVTVAGAALVLLAPLLLVAAVALRLETGHGVIFRQERLGLDGRPFPLLKLQTLVPVDDAESHTRWNVGGDARLGPVGRLLRATSIDELPQLWNVLRGDMSLVGPRPERPYFAQAFSKHLLHYDARHRVPVGLTGWAQVHGLRGDTSIVDRAAFDNFYIEQWSLWADVKIVLRTIPVALRRTGS